MFTQLVVVGLGNPGTRYDDTRHNVGFMVADALIARHGGRFSFANRALHRARIELGETEVIVVKPMTYMNRSGGALAAMRQSGYEFEPHEVLAVTDDIALPLGRLRLRKKGSAGGHNGLKSIIDILHSDGFGRLRIGVGSPSGGDDAADFVLEPFSADEAAEMKAAVERAVDCIEALVASGYQSAMGRFNAPAAPPSEEPAPESD